MGCSPTTQATWMEGQIAVLEDCMCVVNDTYTYIEKMGFYLEEPPTKPLSVEGSTPRNTVSCLISDLRGKLIDIREMVGMI